MRVFFDRLTEDMQYGVAEHSNYVSWYGDFYTDINRVRQRAATIKRNEDTVDMLGIFEESVHTFEQLHILGFEKTEEVLLVKTGLLSQLEALKALEESKNREDD